jgi:hypothetical protein
MLATAPFDIDVEMKIDNSATVFCPSWSLLYNMQARSGIFNHGVTISIMINIQCLK